MAHREKPLEAIKTYIGGYDLMIERDAGNLIRILTGREKMSREFWSRLKDLCDSVLYELENEKEYNRLPKIRG